MEGRRIETCFSPALFRPDEHTESVVVIIDVLRATSAICNAFENGAEKIVPVTDVEEARAYKKRGFLVAAERDGYVLDFADFGNSPFNFTREKVNGRTIIYSTTNGTGIINRSKTAYMTVIGSFLNLSSLTTFLESQNRDVLLLCAGWKDRFNLEDTLCAGAIAEKLLNNKRFYTICDSTYAAMDLWSLAKDDVSAYIEKAAQRSRLRDKGLDDCITFCMTPDSSEVIPVMKNGVLVNNVL
jgi:2-phosphosulfolactate phosphatase